MDGVDDLHVAKVPQSGFVGLHMVVEIGYLFLQLFDCLISFFAVERGGLSANCKTS